MILIILFCNMAAFLYIGYQSVMEKDDIVYDGNIRAAMDKIGDELRIDENKKFSTKKIEEETGSEKERKVNETEDIKKYYMSKEGKKILEKTKFAWAMAIDKDGAVVWKWKLPEEIPLTYSLSDVATFSRWYLCDYPVRVWKKNGLLFVYAYPKDSYAIINLYFIVSELKNFPNYVKLFLGINLIVIGMFVLALGYRFYRSLKPLSLGIEALSKKEPIRLKEKGIASDLASKINATSKTLQEQEEKLKKRDEARTEWIAGVSHDIRTPLTLIIGYSEQMMNREKERAEWKNKGEQLGQREDRKKEYNNKYNREDNNENNNEDKKEIEMSKAIYRQALIIRQLIEDLNLTSKLAYNVVPLSLTLCEPAKLLRESVTDLYNDGLEEQYEIELDISREAERSKILADEKMLKRAIRNILGNSIRHNKDGCVVTAILAQKNEMISYKFIDTGPGIPRQVVEILQEEEREEKNEEKLKKEKFKKMEEGREEGREKESEKVHIMGLRLTRQIVKMHGAKFVFCQRKSGEYDCEILLPLTIGEKRL